MTQKLLYTVIGCIIGFEISRKIEKAFESINWIEKFENGGGYIP